MLNMSNYTEEDDSDDYDRDTFLSIKEGAANNHSDT